MLGCSLGPGSVTHRAFHLPESLREIRRKAGVSPFSRQWGQMRKGLHFCTEGSCLSLSPSPLRKPLSIRHTMCVYIAVWHIIYFCSKSFPLGVMPPSHAFLEVLVLSYSALGVWQSDLESMAMWPKPWNSGLANQSSSSRPQGLFKPWHIPRSVKPSPNSLSQPLVKSLLFLWDYWL